MMTTHYRVFHIQNMQAQKTEFEKAGFTDFDAKLRAWVDSDNHETSNGIQPAGLPLYFPSPPVCTAKWDTQSWLRFVDWTSPANAKALDQARQTLAQRVTL